MSLHGVDLRPGDLDIVQATDRPNLERLRAALREGNAHPDPGAPFGDWQLELDGERRWVEREPRPGEREARASWIGDPDDMRSFDYQYATSFGALDVVPEIGGTYADLARRATTVRAFGTTIVVEGIGDLLATITVPRRPKDRERVQALRELQRRRNLAEPNEPPE